MNTNEETGTGFLKIRTVSAGGALPVSDTIAIVIDEETGTTLYSLRTDSSGLTPKVPLAAPRRSLSQSPSPPILPYSVYTLQISKPGYLPVKDYSVPVFDGITSVQTVNLIPEADLDLLIPSIGSGEVITPGYPLLDGNIERQGKEQA